MLVKPLNKRLLLEKVEMEQKENNLGFFMPEEKTGTLGDFYRVLDISEDCDTIVWKGDLISAEVVTAVGRLEGKTYYVCHQNSIVAVLKEK